MERFAAQSSAYFEAASNERDLKQNGDTFFRQPGTGRGIMPRRNLTVGSFLPQILTTVPPSVLSGRQTQNGNRSSQNDRSVRQVGPLPESSTVHAFGSRSKPSQQQSCDASLSSQKASTLESASNPPQLGPTPEDHEVLAYFNGPMSNANGSTTGDLSHANHLGINRPDVQKHEVTTTSPCMGTNHQPSVPSDQPMTEAFRRQRSNIELLHASQQIFYRYSVTETSLLNYILSLFYYCSLHLIPLNAFYKSMDTLFDQHIKLIIDDSPTFRRLVVQMMINIKEHHSALNKRFSSSTQTNGHGRLCLEYDSNQDFIKWGDFSAIRDRYGRRVNMNFSEYNAVYNSNEKMYWTKYYQAAVLDLCEKILKAICKTQAQPIRRNPVAMEDSFATLHGGDGASHNGSHLTNGNFANHYNVNNAQNSEKRFKSQEHPPQTLTRTEKNIEPQSDSDNDDSSDKLHAPSHVSFAAKNQTEQKLIIPEMPPGLKENRTAAGQSSKQNHFVAKPQPIPLAAAFPTEQKPLHSTVSDSMGQVISSNRRNGREEQCSASQGNCMCKSHDQFNTVHTRPNGDLIDIRRMPEGGHRVMLKHTTGYKLYCERDSRGYIDVFIKRPSGFVDVICTDPLGQLHVFFKPPLGEIQDFCPEHASNLDAAHKQYIASYVEKIAGVVNVGVDEVTKQAKFAYLSEEF